MGEGTATLLIQRQAVEKDPLWARKEGRPAENYLLMANDPIYKTKCLLNANPLNRRHSTT